MTIQRYGMIATPHDNLIGKSRDGDFVSYTDHLALVAAAYHDAGGVMDTYLGNARIGHSSVVRALEELAGWLRDNILAKTPADAQTALTAIERAAYERGADEALSIVLASAVDILAHLAQVGDEHGAHALRVFVETLEQHRASIPVEVAKALSLLTQEGR